MLPESTCPVKLRVAVIGGGVAGLAVAGFLRRHHQYNITVYERRPAEYKESSAALGMRANGISVVKQLGITREEIRAVAGAGYRTYNVQEKEMSKSVLDDGDEKLWFVFRQDLKDALLRRLASEVNGENPVSVLFGSHIVAVDPEVGSIKFEDDTTVEVDLIIGADGIHSKVRAAVIPASHPAPIPCGLSVYRFVLPMTAVKDAVAPDQWPYMFNYDSGTFVAIIAAGDAENRHVVMYPCRGHEQLNVACAVSDSSFGDASQLKYSWNAKGNVKSMVDGIYGFPDWLQRVFSRVPQVELFQVRDQEPLPTYVKGQTVLIGDAAHAMVPYQGQGANQALEDVEGLDVVLADVTDRDNLGERLKIWDSIRRPRATEIQRGSRVSQGKIATRGASEAILSVKPYICMKQALEQLQSRRQMNT